MRLSCEKCGALLRLQSGTEALVFVHTDYDGQTFCGALLARTPGNSRVAKTELVGKPRSVSVALECSECGKLHAFSASVNSSEVNPR